MEGNSSLLKKIKGLEGELKSFEEDREEKNIEISVSKKKIIEQAKSGDFENMLNEIEERKNNKKQESFLTRIFKLF